MRLTFGAFELEEPGERHARADPRQPVANERRVDEHAVLGQHVRKVARVRVEVGPLLLEPYPAMENEHREPGARLEAERPRGVEAAADLGRIDPEQTDASDRRDVDRVAVDHRAHEDSIGPFEGSGGLNTYNDSHAQSDQKLHTRSPVQRVTRIANAWCKRPADRSPTA